MLEVLIPGSEEYTTLAEFKAFYGITSSTEDAYWEGHLTTASEIVSEYCGRPLCSEAVRETLRFDQKTRAIVLERWPISATPTMTYGVSNMAVSSSLYEVDVRSGVLRGVGSSGMYVPFDCGVWKVMYSGGYVSIPSAVKQAVWQLAKNQSVLSKLSTALKSKRIEGVITESYFEPYKFSDDLPSGVKSLLRRYVER